MLPDEHKSKDNLIERVEVALDMLYEHCDSVQIFVSKLFDDGNTGTYTDGKGNWYARKGQVREWVEKENRFVTVINEE
ncbi:MAG: hypothetical protein PHS31_04330 [Victivallaceae bacterium]|nr:hypothetical protein [Victivallaceae bacterium]